MGTNSPHGELAHSAPPRLANTDLGCHTSPKEPSLLGPAGLPKGLICLPFLRDQVKAWIITEFLVNKRVHPAITQTDRRAGNSHGRAWGPHSSLPRSPSS